MRLIKGDCLEEMAKLEDGSVDLVLTDPPYGMKFISNFRKKKYNAIENDDSLDWVPKFVDELYGISAKNCAVYSFCSFHNLEVFKIEYAKKFRVKNILVWEKSGGALGDLTGDFMPKTEFIIFATKGRPLIRGKRTPNIFKFKRTKSNVHPTQKPIDLLEHLIAKFSDDGQTVFDPFMGSGSTGVACVNTDRNFIGIEKDEKYFEIAKKRIYNES